MIDHPVSIEAPALLGAATLFALHAGPGRAAEHVDVFGRAVRVDIYEPKGTLNRGRTILLLHGIGGLLGDGALMRRAARDLSEQGFRAGVVHYFNATGTLFATHANVREHAAAWKSALVQIAAHYAETSGAPVGLFGYSLGGFLAVGAAQEVPAVRAVTVLAGGILEEHERLTPPHLPALLVLHGGVDVKVPPERAEALLRMARRSGASVECVMYPREGHSLGSRAERDAFTRSARFFASQLGSRTRP